MYYISLDLEYNQPSEVKSDKWQARYIKNEIIEIGASKFDQNFKFVSGFKCYIKPFIYPKINDVVLNLLGFETQDYINTNGTKLTHAMELFKNFVGKDNFIFLTWGNNDVKILKQNCGAFKIDYSWFKNRKTIDVQECYMTHMNIAMMPSLKKAINEIGLILHEHQIHQAFYDSLNNMKVAQYLGKDFINSYKKPKKEFKMPKNLKSNLTERINCPKCGRFTTNIKISKINIPFKLNHLITVSKLNKCNKCGIFIDTKYI